LKSLSFLKKKQLRLKTIDRTPTCDRQVCTSLQTDNHASTPQLSFFTGRMPFLLPNQQRQSSEGNSFAKLLPIKLLRTFIVVVGRPVMV